MTAAHTAARAAPKKEGARGEAPSQKHTGFDLSTNSYNGSWSPASEQTPRRDDGGWFRVIRSPQTKELLRHPLAFALLALISYRARWKLDGFNIQGLEWGEALIGDFKKAGLKSRVQYRSALELLIQLGLITTKRTNRGTIVGAKQIPTIVFHVLGEHLANHDAATIIASNE